MSSTPPSGGIVFVEPLESRIAPTGLLAISGDPGDASATANSHYVTFQTTPTATSLGFVPASVYGINVPNLFAIKLTGDGTFNATTGASNGDELVVFNTVTGFNTAVPLIQANKGPVIAFFINDPGLHGDATRPINQVYADELVGVSLGKKDIVSINGNVYGDIVTNLLNGGNTLSLTGDGGPSQGINGITMNGNVFGNILAGGNIKNVTVVGQVGGVLAGTATNALSFNFSGGTAGASGTIVNTDNAVINHGGANIIGLTVSMIAAGGRIQAGDAGFSGIGGAISQVTVQSDTNAFSILSGAGGNGDGGTFGGAGGAISGVTIQGAAESTANSLILIEAGHGGDNATGHAGAGGAITGVGVGFDVFDTVNSIFTASADLLSQNVIVEAGAGGTGIRGGNGGSIDTTQVIGAIPDDGVTNANGTANAEIQVLGGAGGVAASTTHGKGGHGGNLSGVTAENLDATTAGQTSSILVAGGDGGAGTGGGNITGLDLLGTILTANGGAGGTGLKGGGGGSLDTVAILSQSNLFTRQLTLNAGTGGVGTNGAGGVGGSINSVAMADADIAALTINGGTHGNGGAGDNGVGGAGGAVTNVALFNSAPSGIVGTVVVRSGTGGDGATGGGAGGTIDTFQFLGGDFGLTLTAGAGGRAATLGDGGAGGSLSNVGVSNTGSAITATVDVTTLVATATAGAGGNGVGLGGAGGGLLSVNLQAVYDVIEVAGGAGNGGGGAGAGGGISGSAAIALEGSAYIAAGAGGQASGAASDGGTITGFVASAEASITMLAGNGGSGGVGGSITSSGTTTDSFTGVPNFGNLTVTAGSGSNLGHVSGAGGSITTFNGYVADAGTTALTAGAGGGGGASAPGGGIDTVKLIGTSDTFAETTQIVTLDGGDAGITTVSNGGKPGGTVNNVVIYDLDAGTLVQHIAAGNGGGALRRGGAGGSVTNIHVGIPNDGADDDIGVRSGLTYGYAVGDAGGLFAGIGGNGAKRAGADGSVTDVTATAISSIVAGKGPVPGLCTKVDNIYLEGLTATVAAQIAGSTAGGAFTNFDTANLVGSVLNPADPNASVFAQGDGLIATANLTGNRNFVPEALLTLDTAGNLSLVDYQQPDPNPAVSAAPAFLT